MELVITPEIASIAKNMTLMKKRNGSISVIGYAGISVEITSTQFSPIENHDIVVNIGNFRWQYFKSLKDAAEYCELMCEEANKICGKNT